MRGDRQEFVPRGHRGAEVGDEPVGLLLGDRSQAALVLQIFVQRQQPHQQFPHDVGGGVREIVVGDAGAPGADFRQVPQDLSDDAVLVRRVVAGRHRSPLPPSRGTTPA